MEEGLTPLEGGAGAWTRVIGIVGGLGPHAHIRFEELLLREAEMRAPGAPLSDQDYPPYIVSSLPQTPDRTAALFDRGPSPLPWLERSLRALGGGLAAAAEDRLRADFAVIACNTAHAHLPELRASGILPILDLVGETIDSISAGEKVRMIGLLATTGTVEARIYHAAAAARGVTVISPLDLPGGAGLQQSLVMDSIYGTALQPGIKAGALRRPEHHRRLLEALEQAVALLREAGAELIVAGCTEIPLALRPGSADLALGIEVIDPLEVGARVALEIAAGERDLPSDHTVSSRRSAR